MPHIHNIYDSDTHFSINPITRKIRNESSTKTSLIQHDHNSERLTFEMPRFVEGHDMSLCDKIEIHYINLSASNKNEKSEDVYLANDVQISPEDENVVIFSWLISGNATKYAGTLNFLISFKCLTGDVIDYAWHTEIFKSISIGEGMNNGEAVVAEYSDVLEAWKKDVETGFYPNTAKFAMPKWAEVFDFEEKPYTDALNHHTFEKFHEKFHALCGINYEGQAVLRASNTDCAIGATVPASYSSSTLKGIEIPCVAGDVFEIKAKGHANARLWCFVDANRVKLIGATQNGTENNSYNAPVTITAPENAATLIINFYFEEYPDTYIKKMNDGLLEINMDMEYLAQNTDAIPEHISGITNGGMYMYHLPAPSMNTKGGTTKHKTLKVLLVSGIHGSEKKSIWNNYYLLKALTEGTPESRALTMLRNFCDIYVIPLACPSGIQNNTYKNADGVNINRDFEVENWISSSGSGASYNSQYETRCISWWIGKIKPDCMVDHHTSSGDERTESGKFVQWGLSDCEAVASLIEENIIEVTPYIKRRYPEKLAKYNHIFGHTENPQSYIGVGMLGKHCHERYIISATYEVVMHLYWDGGYIFGYAEEDETAIMTIDYHGYINFLLKYIQLVVKMLDK
jgi:hypothetical protein